MKFWISLYKPVTLICITNSSSCLCGKDYYSLKVFQMSVSLRHIEKRSAFVDVGIRSRKTFRKTHSPHTVCDAEVTHLTCVQTHMVVRLEKSIAPFRLWTPKVLCFVIEDCHRPIRFRCKVRVKGHTCHFTVTHRVATLSTEFNPQKHTFFQTVFA